MNSTLNVVTEAPVATVVAMASPRIWAINAGFEAKPAAAATVEMPEAMANDDRSPCRPDWNSSPRPNAQACQYQAEFLAIAPIKGAMRRRDLGLNNAAQSYSINARSGPVFRDAAPWEG